ncbi:MAG: hypothetical protein J5789_00420 [Oscillospiraceae bacterium]|nr:hypothetical protein [Oscillospiraceae bacterium]
MKKCSFCGRNNPDENTRCATCGCTLPESANQPESGSAGSYTNPHNVNSQSNGYGQGGYNQYNGYGQGDYNQYNSYGRNYAPPRYPSSGLIAWSIVTLLFCTIPGIVALVYAVGINSSTSSAEQERKISNAKTWCTVGTVLSVLALIYALAVRR